MVNKLFSLLGEYRATRFLQCDLTWSTDTGRLVPCVLKKLNSPSVTKPIDRYIKLMKMGFAAVNLPTTVIPIFTISSLIFCVRISNVIVL